MTMAHETTPTKSDAFVATDHKEPKGMPFAMPLGFHIQCNHFGLDMNLFRDQPKKF